MPSKNFDFTIQHFSSHEEADRANAEFYASLTNDQRLEIALELMRPVYEAYPRFERIYRTAELGECPESGDWEMDLLNQNKLGKL
jgi:hypothetical protein